MSKLLWGLLAVGVFNTGCNTECLSNQNFPRCEHRFDRAEIYAYDIDNLLAMTKNADPDDVLDIPLGEQAHFQISGDDYLGVNWSIYADEEYLWIGLVDNDALLQLSIDALMDCEDGTVWNISDATSSNTTALIEVRADNPLCATRPLLRQWSAEKGRFGAKVLTLRDIDNKNWLFASAPDGFRRHGVVGMLDLAAADNKISAYWKGPTVGTHWGENLVECGDLTADGLPDVLVSSPAAFNQAGAIQLIPSNNLSEISGEQPVLTENIGWRGAAPNDRAGTAIWCAGDLTGDSFADILIGAPFDDGCLSSTTNNCGAIYLIRGGPNIKRSGLLTEVAHRVIRNDIKNGYCGQTIAATTFNQDSHLDLAIGCPGSFNGRGSVQLYTTESDPSASAPSEQLKIELLRIFEGTKNPTTSTKVDTQAHYGRALVAVNRKGTGIFMGSPTVTNSDLKLNAGLIEYWPGNTMGSIMGNQRRAQPSLRIHGTAPFQKVGGNVWLSDLLFIKTQHN